jgi:hypothetical protein
MAKSLRLTVVQYTSRMARPRKSRDVISVLLFVTINQFLPSVISAEDRFTPAESENRGKAKKKAQNNVEKSISRWNI